MDRPRFTVTYNGVQSTLTAYHEEDEISGPWKKGKFYDERLLNRIAWHSDKGTIRPGAYLDIGANVGNHSVFFGRHTNATAVVAVEMSPVLFPILEENLVRNLTWNWKAIQSCVMEKPLSYVCVGLPPPRNSGKSEVLQAVGAPLFDEINAKGGLVHNWVPSTTIDQIANEIAEEFRGPISFIKLDIERMEIPALEGARRTICEHRPVLAVECQDKRMLRKTNDLLSRFRYILFAGACDSVYMWKPGSGERLEASRLR